MDVLSTPVSDYMRLYKYLSVLNADQILKLRQIAIGVLDISAFTESEIYVLEAKLMLSHEKRDFGR